MAEVLGCWLCAPEKRFGTTARLCFFHIRSMRCPHKQLAACWMCNYPKRMWPLLWKLPMGLQTKRRTSPHPRFAAERARLESLGLLIPAEKASARMQAENEVRRAAANAYRHARQNAINAGRGGSLRPLPECLEEF